MHQPEDGKKFQGQFLTAGRFVGKGGGMVRQERTDADHFGAEGLDEEEVFHQVVEVLSRTANHDAGSRLVADVLQVLQALPAMEGGHFCRMEVAVMNFVERFVTEQVPVGSCPEEAFVSLAALFTQRQGDGTVGKLLSNDGHSLFHPVIGLCRVFAPLQDKGAEAEGIALAAAVQDGITAQAVACHRRIAFPDTAVQAVVPASVPDFDQSADIDFRTEMGQGRAVGLLLQVSCRFRVVSLQQGPVVLAAQSVFVSELVNQSFHGEWGWMEDSVKKASFSDAEV